MATRALAIAGRRVAGQNGVPAALASCRRRGGGGGAQSDSSSRRSAHTQAAEDQGHDAVSAEQVEAALNSKNVEEVVFQEQGPSRAATVRLPDEVVDDADAAWVPDQDTGVFVPAEEANSGATHDAPAPAASVLDQTVFVREEEMEDVERPAVDMANGIGSAK